MIYLFQGILTNALKVKAIYNMFKSFKCQVQKIYIFFVFFRQFSNTFGGKFSINFDFCKLTKWIYRNLTYARHIFEVLCVLRVPWERPDVTDVHLETGLERDLLWGLTWARIKIIECLKSLSPSTDLCQTDFWSPLSAQGSLRASRRDRCPLRDWSRKGFALEANLGQNQDNWVL